MDIIEDYEGFECGGKCSAISNSTTSSVSGDYCDAEIDVDDAANLAHEQTTNVTDIMLSLTTGQRHHFSDTDDYSDSEEGSSEDDGDDREEHFYDDDPTDIAIIDDELVNGANYLFAEDLLGEDFEREAANIGAFQVCSVPYDLN